MAMTGNVTQSGELWKELEIADGKDRSSSLVIGCIVRTTPENCSF